MIKGKRFPSTAPLVLFAALLAGGPLVLPAFGGMTIGKAERRRMSAKVVGSNSEAPGTSGNTSSSADTTGQAFTLVSLKHETVGPLTRIIVESSAPPLYSVSRPSDRLIVVELPGGDGSKLAREYSLDTASVDSIRVRGNGASTGSKVHIPSGRAQTSIEIAVKSGIRDNSALSGNTLVLELSPAANGADSTASGRPTGTGADSKPGPETAGVYVYPVSLKSSSMAKGSSKAEPSAPEQATLKPATVLRSVRTEPGDGTIRILLDSDGKAEFKDFTLTDPSRIVVDVIGVRWDFGNKTMTVESGGIDRIRVGQPNSRTVRVVVDAKQKVPYRVVREGASLVIEISSQGTRAGAIVTPQPAGGREVEPQPVRKPDAAAPQPKEQVQQAPPSSADKKPVKQSEGMKSSSTASGASTAPSASPAKSPSTAKSDAQAGNVKAAATDSKAGRPKTQSGVSASGKTAQSATDAANSGARNTGAVAASQSGAAPSTPTPQQPAVTGSQTSSVSRKDLIAKDNSPSRSVIGANRSAQNPITDVSARDSGRDKAGASRRRPDVSMCDAEYVGGPISFDLRAVDIREMLRFIYQNYGVNFIVDKSVTQVPVDITITGVPWNQVMNAVLRANRLGWVCEDQGRIVRIATLAAIKEEESERQAILDEKNKGIPLKTVIRHLKYARANGSLAGTGSGASSGGGGGAGGGIGGGGGGGAAGGRGTILSIITSRNSPRGKTEVDSRTNSLIITDIPERVDAIMSIVDLLDKPEAQVEIEGRIIVADRNFLRDLGVQLAGAVQNSRTGGTAILETAPVILSNPGTISSSQGSGASSGGSGSGAGGGGSTNQISGNLPFNPAQSALQATANTVLGLTSGRIGTGILSAALSASESKGQIRTISTPRITAQDNMTAEIVNGVQIPVQTVSNNTVSTTFVTAALRLEITPQIVEETGEVTMHIVAENNTVNTSLANQFNGGTPGINTQSAESVMRVKDGGTAVMGGINIDNESTTVNSTPGLGSIPILGNLFKRKTVSRDNSEILFFISPRIVHRDSIDAASAGAPGARSSVVPNEPADDKVKDASPKAVSPAPASVAGSPSASK